jgi:hypothetical protein
LRWEGGRGATILSITATIAPQPLLLARLLLVIVCAVYCQLVKKVAVKSPLEIEVDSESGSGVPREMPPAPEIGIAFASKFSPAEIRLLSEAYSVFDEVSRNSMQLLRVM